MMAVPQYPYPVLGGLERQAHELAKTLLSQGVLVRVISGQIESTQPLQEVVEGVIVDRIPWSTSKAKRFSRAPFHVFRVMWMRRHAYDVVHLHQFSWFGLFVIVVSRLIGRPVLTKLPNVGEFGLPGLAASAFGHLKVWIFRRSDAVVAMSAESLGELRAVGYPLSRALRLHNGIDLTGGVALAESKGAGADGRVVFVGRLSEEKGIEDLLRVWSGVLAAVHCSATLEIWGGGPQEGELRALVRRLGIEGSVTFRGHIQNVRQRLQGMDLFVLPSRAEGNSNSILEAMAAGLPVISTRVGGTPLLVGQAGAPYLIDAGDRRALQEQIITLLNDMPLRMKLGRLMRERVQRHFDLRLVAATYAKAYQYLADGRREEMARLGSQLLAIGGEGDG